MANSRKPPSPRNPIAPELRDPKYRKKVEKSPAEKADQRDPWSKKGKHKKAQSLDEFYQVGDKVSIVNGPLKKVLDRAEKIRLAKKRKDGVTPEEKSQKSDEHAIVRQPKGPAGTLGITLDGEYHIVDEEDVQLIYEAFDYVELTEWSYAETTSGIRVPVSGEEAEILNRCSAPIYKTNMDDREQEVARRMVSRGVLHRNKDEEGIYFIRDNQKLTRF